VRPSMGRWTENRPLRSGRIADEYFRRQLELARPGLVADQLPAHRIAPEIPSLLRRRFQSRMPDRFRALSQAERNRGRIIESPDSSLASRWKWRAALRTF